MNASLNGILRGMTVTAGHETARNTRSLSVLLRASGIDQILLELVDPRRYAAAVKEVAEAGRYVDAGVFTFSNEKVPRHESGIPVVIRVEPSATITSSMGGLHQSSHWGIWFGPNRAPTTYTLVANYPRKLNGTDLTDRMPRGREHSHRASECDRLDRQELGRDRRAAPRNADGICASCLMGTC